MSHSAGSLREQLLENEEYRKLDQEHHDYEAKLMRFVDRPLLSDDEQVEETTLKKKKLLVKDRMEAIARQLRVTQL